MSPTPAIDLAAALLALASTELRTPEARERLGREICKTLASLGVTCGGRCSEVDAQRAALLALDEAARKTGQANDAIVRAEILVERMCVRR